MVRPIVHSVKHYVQQSLNTITGSAKADIVVVQAVTIDAVNTVQEVVEGSIVKAVYIEIWLRAAGASPGSVIVACYKDPGGGIVFSTTELAAMGLAENKKNVFFFSQGLINDNDADAIPFYRGWIKIPKSKQRFGLGDRFIISIFAQGAIDTIHCGFQTYKAYT